MGGERPIVEIMTINFLLVAIDQVVNHAAKVRTMFGGEVGCPMVIRTPNGAGNLEDSFSFQVSDGFGGTGTAVASGSVSRGGATGRSSISGRTHSPARIGLVA